MTHPSDILHSIGLDRASAALGVSMARIERATRDAKLPASWLDTLERLAGHELPRELFSFKGA